MKNKNIRMGRDTILVKLIRFDIPLSLRGPFCILFVHRVYSKLFGSL